MSIWEEEGGEVFVDFWWQCFVGDFDGETWLGGWIERYERKATNAINERKANVWRKNKEESEY